MSIKKINEDYNILKNHKSYSMLCWAEKMLIRIQEMKSELINDDRYDKLIDMEKEMKEIIERNK